MKNLFSIEIFQKTTPPRRIFLFGLIALATFDLFCSYQGLLHLSNSVHLPYYSQLAWSFLHGRLYFIEPLPGIGDLSPYQGHLYAYWPPLTAVLMMPLVYLRGVDDFPQRLFAIFFGVLNTGLFYLIVDRFQDMRRQTRPLWLTVLAALFFGWGTSNLVFSLIANHWFIGQLTASTFLLLALYWAIDRRPDGRRWAAVGSAWSLAIATTGRQHLLLAWPFFVYLALSDATYHLSGEGNWFQRICAACWQRQNRRLLFEMTFPILLTGGLMLWYNHARFGQWFENGLTYHLLDPRLYVDFHRYGYFHLRYIPQNIYYLLLRFPGFERWDHQPGWMGFSLFAQCPIFLLVFGGPTTPTESDLTTGLWLATGSVSLPVFMLLSPGFGQFGARYLYDVVPFLTLLVMQRQSRVPRSVFVALGVLSIGINLLGPLFILDRIHF